MIAHLLLVPKSFVEHVNILKRLFSFFGNTVRVDRDLKQRRRRRQRELQKRNRLRLAQKKKIWLFCKKKSRFFVHCFAVTARQRREIPLVMEDVNSRQWLSFSFSELRYSLLEFNSRKKRQHLTNWTSWNNHDKFWGARRDFWSVVFVVIVFVAA